MKILLSAYECEPNRGREQGRGWNCALELARLGHDVWVLTPSKNKHHIIPELERQALPNLTFIYIDDSALIRRYLTNKTGTILRYFLWQQKAYKVAKALDRTHDFSVVHHVTMGSLTGGSWLWQLKKPFVFGPAGGGQIAPAAFKKYFYGAWWPEAWRSLIVKHLIPLNPLTRNTFSHTQIVLAANCDTIALAKRIGAPRAELFFDAGLPDDYFPESPPERSPSNALRLFWVARMFPRKALRLALEAVADVDASIPVILTIAGGGTQEHDLPQWIEELGLGDRVRCLGFLEWDAVKAEYLKQDALLFTSLRDTGGAQLLEAMAQGLPIITLNHHGAGDHIPDQAGVKVPVIQPEKTLAALTQAIERLYNNTDARLQMGRCGFEYAKTQTWPKKVRKISDFYDELVAQYASTGTSNDVKASEVQTLLLH
ncbi:MAG: glycosyltransferase family 4 protein [Cyanobacteria bacterium P01_A01_bin.37]